MTRRDEPGPQEQPYSEVSRPDVAPYNEVSRPDQAPYNEDAERRIQEEIQEGEAQRQKSYSKDDEKGLQEEIDRESGDEMQ